MNHGRGFAIWVRHFKRNMGVTYMQLNTILQVSPNRVFTWQKGLEVPRDETVELMASLENERRRREREGQNQWSYLAILRFARQNMRSLPKKEPKRVTAISQPETAERLKEKSAHA